MEMQHDWHRRQAINVVAALPETHEDALAVLDFARELVEGFLGGGQPLRAPDERGDLVRVVSLSSSIKGAKR